MLLSSADAPKDNTEAALALDKGTETETPSDCPVVSTGIADAIGVLVITGVFNFFIFLFLVPEARHVWF
jgi:hypothetical protein